MKTVFHLSTDDTAKVSELLGNIKNLKEDETVEIEKITALLNGDAVLTALEGSGAEEFIRGHLEDGVEFRVCSNSVDGRDLDREELIDGVEVVSSGVGELNRLQEEDFNYIRL